MILSFINLIYIINLIIFIVMVGKLFLFFLFLDVKEFFNGDLVGIFFIEIELGFGIFMMVVKIILEASVDVTLSEEVRVMEMREIEILGMRLGF